MAEGFVDRGLRKDGKVEHLEHALSNRGFSINNPASWIKTIALCVDFNLMSLGSCSVEVSDGFDKPWFHMGQRVLRSGEMFCWELSTKVVEIVMDSGDRE